MTVPKFVALAAASLALLTSCGPRQEEVPETRTPSDSGYAEVLASWNDGAAKAAIVDFVAAVTAEGGPDFVPPGERIAVFDNDGTLWVEQPLYVQLQFAFDRVRALAAQHPEWKTTQPFQAVLEGDMEAVLASGHRGLAEILMASHAGMTTDEFEAIVEEWIATAAHPRFERKYPDLTYAPMVELLDYLRAHGFKTFIVSGGGVEFMRPFTQEAYGIPPEQVIGSSIRTEFAIRDGEPVLVRLPEVFFIDDKEGKPIAIQKIIGRRPIAAFGNSDGDLQMIQWTKAGEGRRLAMFVHHTDAEREYAYDREGHVGRMDRALDLAAANDWILIDMKEDWNRVFAP